MALNRAKPMKRGGPLNPYSKRRWEQVTAAGFRPVLTFAPRPREPFTAKAKVQRYTGPKRSVCDLVDERSGGMCEWPGCPRRGVERHHRLNRKFGGRHGEMAELVNGAAWLLKVCRVHHAYATSPSGEARRECIRTGWLLLERQDALRVPVLTRHDEEPVWFLPDGSWLRYEEACA